MPNIHGLHSLRSNNNAGRNNRENDDSDDDDDDGTNDRYVGGVDSRGGGSGLAVVPNRDRDHRPSDAIFNLAEADQGGSSGRGGGGGGAGGVPHRRTIITMYRSGFTVDNGPYRRLDDPANSEFLTSMARGHVPRELREQAAAAALDANDDDNFPEVMVGLVDRRSEEYDPERHGSSSSDCDCGSGGGGERSSGFQSFSGEGQSLGGGGSTTATSTTAASEGGGGGGGIIDPTQSSAPLPLDPNLPSTSIAIRLLNGTRMVIKVNTTSPVSEIGQHIGNSSSDATASSPYVLTSGYPPRIVEDLTVSIEEAGLMGSQVVLKKA